MKLIVEASRLDAFLAPVMTLVDECKLHCNDGHLRITAVDPANVGMVDVTLDVAGCESYDADGEVLGMGLSKLDDVLSFADAGALVELELDTETRKLQVQFDGFGYEIALIDPDSIRQEPDIPELELPATVRCYGRALERGIKGCGLASDHVRFVADAEAGSFRAQGDGDTDAADIQLGDESLPADVEESVASLFSEDYLLDMIGPLASDTEVLVKLGEELPTKWWFEHAEGHVAVTYMLAPRIQSD